MSSGDGDGPPLPDHPELRSIAQAMEGCAISGEICDATWRVVFISSEEARIIGVPPSQVSRFYGKGLPRRQLEDGEYWATTDESSAEWWQLNVPIMRATLSPEDPWFDDVFGPLAKAATRIEAVDSPPRAWFSKHDFPDLEGLRTSWLGMVSFIDIRLNDDSGAFIGVARLSRPDLPESLMTRLARGSREMFERMNDVSAPTKRPAAILFADLEASGEHSRHLSSRGYFELVRGLVDLIDGEVVRHGGIVGKHAGDGASALFLREHHRGSESATAAAALAAARTIRAGAQHLKPAETEVLVNIGVHWGATLTIGQVATRGRLEVTALGDEMNEAARIESAATGGTALASKHLLERLDDEEAVELGLDLASISYRTVAELDGSNPKAVRDAGAIPVAAI